MFMSKREKYCIVSSPTSFHVTNFLYIYSTTVRNIWEHTIFLSHRADRPICCLVWSELTTMLSVSPVMEIGSIRVSTLILIYFSPLYLFMSLRSAHIFSTAHLLTFLIPAFLSSQLYSVSFFFFSFFALLLTPDLLSSVPPTLFAISTTPSIHIGLLCLPLGRHCNWLYPQGPPWSWFYQHYRRLSIERKGSDLSIKRDPILVAQRIFKFFLKLVLPTDYWVDGVSPQLTSQNLGFI